MSVDQSAAYECALTIVNVLGITGTTTTLISPSPHVKGPTVSFERTPQGQNPFHQMQSPRIVVTVVILVLIVLSLAVGIPALALSIFFMKKRHHRRHSRSQMTNCKPTLAAMLSRENPNALLPGICFVAPNLNNDFYSSNEQEPISRQMANVRMIFSQYIVSNLCIL